MNPVFFCDDLAGDEVVLSGPEGRHAAVVRRIRAGEVVDLVDGRGTRCTGAVTAVTAQSGAESVTVGVTTRVAEPAPAPRITLVQALAKGDRGELAVELATEVGADVIVPWAAARCVTKWEGERGAKHLQRWRSTAFEAAKQSRRAWFPEVRELATTRQVAALPGRLMVLHEEATIPLAALVGGSGPSAGQQRPTMPDRSEELVLVVGPEGGITPAELEELGGSAVRLGPTVLRTSTAGAAAIAVVSALTGRW